MKDDKIKYTRDELYAEVWKRPIRDIAKDLNISDVGLRKICIKMDIPLPVAGHWSKIKVGKIIKIPQLPAIKDNTLEEYTFITQVKKKIEFSETAKNVYHDLKKHTLQTTTNKIHPLVKETSDLLKKGFIVDGRVVNNEKQHLSIYVSKQQLPRALSIFNSLIIELEEMNFNVLCGKEGTIVMVDNEKIPILIKEKMQREALPKEHPYSFTLYKYIPTGKLFLSIGEFFTDTAIRRNFGDNQLMKIEDKISDFISALIIASQAIKERNRKLAELHRIFEERRKAEEEQRRLLQLEKDRMEKLQKIIDNWEFCQKTNSFIEEYKSRMVDKQVPEEELKKIEEWIKWAQEFVEKNNPINNSLKLNH